MVSKIAAFVIAALGLSACTSAYGDELSNLTLGCKGKLWIYGKTNVEEVDWDTNFQIKNNIIFNDDVKLKIFDHAVVAQKKKSERIEYAFSLDRFTGNLTYIWEAEAQKARFNFQAKCNKLDQKLF